MSDTTTDLTPALTPEQWAKRGLGPDEGESPTEEAAISIAASDGAIVVANYKWEVASVPVTQHHALAALCNEALRRAGHPGAITREDVDFLYHEAWELLDEGAINLRRRRMSDIARRLEAFLPPKTP